MPPWFNPVVKNARVMVRRPVSSSVPLSLSFLSSSLMGGGGGGGVRNGKVGGWRKTSVVLTCMFDQVLRPSL